MSAPPLIDLELRKSLRAGARRFELALRLRSHNERIVVLGPSGAGKTLLLHLIAGLTRPDAGSIHLQGRCLHDSARRVDVPARARGVGFVFQDYALFPHLDARQNIGFGLHRGWRGPSRRWRDPRVEEWLQRFGLGEVAHQYPSELSGGQRQRVALARALVSAPSVLLLDEPFAALDTGLRRSLRAELDQLQRRLRVPMLLVTHDPEDAEYLGGEVLRLREGRVESAD
ncbi:MAG: ATP-binding cassette domain-containing protein [Xanthomonadales bacterium]|nr:Sulfate/thiosulfate import ATP-binding protein CysA [Xanthomonadales bacterium]MCC6592895.1 ATP-binding cassette domain-containing protein [Xanthomonadales bacterium]MCE7930776.1 ATP-binding cassette domain-containing protein [Xanthomonadales bacterium PRO6]